jgi:Na+/proline symporter
MLAQFAQKLTDLVHRTGLKPIDLAVIAAYFVAVMAVGFWVSRKVKNETDYFLGGRKFGKGLLIMHWLCTGTHSEMAVQVAGASARVGLGGIWYQWMWMFSTPFYWFIAPVTRRLRVITTGDFFRIRYGRSVEVLYTLVAMVYFVQSIAALLRGAGAAISGATGGALPTEYSVVVLSVLFSTYILAGGLVSAAYTDFLQGILIIVLSILLVPFGLSLIGGVSGLHQALPPHMFSITAPAGAPEGTLSFVVAMSVIGLVGIVAQPHVMTATGSGKSETEARVGMVYGNFIKRVLTIAWTFTGLIAVVAFAGTVDLTGPDAVNRSEQLYGQAVQHFLGDGWRGLMIACLIAGVTSAETIMVVGSALLTRNFYVHIVRGRGDRHYLWAGRGFSAFILALSVFMAFHAESVTKLFVNSVQVIALLGAAFWLGVTWRRANAVGVWTSFLGTVFVWAAMTVQTEPVPDASFLPVDSQSATAPLTPTTPDVSLLQAARNRFISAAEWAHLRDLSKAAQIAVTLSVEFGLLIVVSLLTPAHRRSRLDPFFARLLTPVGKEDEVLLPADAEVPEFAALGLDSPAFDYQKAAAYGYPLLRPLGIEIPRMTWFDWGGFLAAWVLVGALIGSLVLLAGWGA